MAMKSGMQNFLEVETTALSVTIFNEGFEAPTIVKINVTYSS
jgi:hypothetical protein